MFLHDLEEKDIKSLIDGSENVNKAYENFEPEFIEVIEKHLPMKKKEPINKPAPFMNKKLHKEIYKKKIAFNKYNQYKSKENW